MWKPPVTGGAIFFWDNPCKDFIRGLLPPYREMAGKVIGGKDFFAEGGLEVVKNRW